MKKLYILFLCLFLVCPNSFAWDLSDPGEDKIMGWDNSAGAGEKMSWFGVGSGLEFSGTNVVPTYGTTGNTIAEGDHTHTGVYQPYSAILDIVTTPGAAGTFLKSDGSSVSWDVAGGAGGGTIGGTVGSVDNIVPRTDGTGGLTIQNSLMSLSDAGSPNIPTGQTYNINGSAHTHNYQPLDTDLTTFAGITPSANVQSVLGAADYSAIRTLLSLRPGTDILATTAVGTTVQAYDADLTSYAGVTPSANALSLLSMTYAQMLTAVGGQATDADLTALAGLSGVRGDIIYRDATQWQRLAKGASGKVLKMGGDDPFWGDDNNDGAAGVSTWDELGDSAADATIALTGYKTIFSSTLNSAGANWTMTNTTADLSADVSFFDFKYTDDGDTNGYFLRGYDNAGSDLKWSIGSEGTFYGFSFETVQSTTGGVFDLLEGSGSGTDYIRLKADDDVGTNRKFAFSSSVANSEDLTIQLGANDNTITVGSSTGVNSIGFGAIAISTTGAIQGAIKINSDANGMSAAEMTTAGMYGTLFIATGSGTWILPTAVSGMSACLMDSGTAHDLVLDATSGDTIRLKGTEGANGATITNATGSTTGDFVCVVAVAANKWSTLGQSGTWTVP